MAIPLLIGIGAAVWVANALTDSSNDKTHIKTTLREVDESEVPLDVLEDIERQEKEAKSHKDNAFVSTWLELGYNYFYGRGGVKMNIEEARNYFQKAASAGSHEAKDMLKRL